MLTSEHCCPSHRTDIFNNWKHIFCNKVLLQDIHNDFSFILFYFIEQNWVTMTKWIDFSWFKILTLYWPQTTQTASPINFVRFFIRSLSVRYFIDNFRLSSSLSPLLIQLNRFPHLKLFSFNLNRSFALEIVFQSDGSLNYFVAKFVVQRYTFNWTINTHQSTTFYFNNKSQCHFQIDSL